MAEKTKTSEAGVVDGVWTPWGEVVCRPCHGQQFAERRISDADHKRLCSPVAEKDLPEGEGITACDKCGRRCHVSEKVASEHELYLLLDKKLAKHPAVKTVGMEQTGGMCSAVGVHLKDGRYLFITEVEEGDEERFYIGAYENEDDGCDEGVSLDKDGDVVDGGAWFSYPRKQAVEVVKLAVERLAKTPKAPKVEAEAKAEAKAEATPAPSAPVGSAAWVLHDDNPQGYGVSLHASEDGVYEAALGRIEGLAKDGVYGHGHELLDEIDLAIKAKDGRRALKAHDAIINEAGGEGVGSVYLWITRQAVEK